MSDKIQADYGILKDLQAKVAQQAEEMRNVLKKLESTAQQLDSGWDGNAADKFKKEWDGLVRPALEKLNVRLDETSAGIGKVAQTFQSAEEEAKSLLHGHGVD